MVELTFEFAQHDSKGDVTRNDSQQRFLEQHSITALLRHCFEWLQHCSNIATLYKVMLHGTIRNDDF